MVWMACLTCAIGVLRRVGDNSRAALHLCLANSVLYHARYQTVDSHVGHSVYDFRGLRYQVWLAICASAGLGGFACPFPPHDNCTQSTVTDYIDVTGAVRHHLWTAAAHVSRPGRYVYFVVNGTLDMTRFFNDFDPPTDDGRLMHSIRMASAYMRVLTGPVRSVVCMTHDTLEEGVLI